MPVERYGLNLNRDRRELKPHGTLGFPCAIYSSEYVDFLYDEFPWHWHEEMEFIYLAEGTLKIQVPGKVLYLPRGQSIFINSKVLHSGAATSYCEKRSLVFHPDLLGEETSVFAKKYITPLKQLSSLDSCIIHSGEQWMKEINRNLLRALEAMNEGGFGYEFEVRESLSQICLSLYHHNLPDSTGIGGLHAQSDQDKLRMRTMLAFIHEHFAENIALSQIAASVNISERECLRCFKRIIQISPMQYLLKYRVTQGAAMLLNSNDSITDISRQCGFDSASYFTHIFKRYFKVTPREYKNTFGDSA